MELICGGQEMVLEKLFSGLDGGVCEVESY